MLFGEDWMTEDVAVVLIYSPDGTTDIYHWWGVCRDRFRVGVCKL